MSVLTALYRTYCSALDNGMVDRTEQLRQQTVLLPVYHSNKKSTGTNDMIEVTLSERGGFIKAEWVPKDQIVIFPVTESSIIRAGKVIAPHPLCDELSYLSRELDPDKNRKYESVREDWVSYMEEGHSNRLLGILNGYLRKGTIFRDCVASLFSSIGYEIGKDYAVMVGADEQTEQAVRREEVSEQMEHENRREKVIHLDKTFVTFRVETKEASEESLSVSTNRELHQNYIDYVRENNAMQPQEKCDISGEMTYCVSRHRGLMGNAKLVSISNHNETYYGRFDAGDEIVHIGYEVSQKIHLMLKYLLENSQNKRQIGESCIIVNWFSDDIGNEEAVNLTDPISPYDDSEEEDDDASPKTLGGGVAVAVNDYITGKRRGEDTEKRFYIMILDKIFNGRISVKYFRELPKSELFERVEYWYRSTNWSFFSSAGKLIKETPSLFRYADTIFGLENEKGYLECRNTKLKTKTLERLLPCILERQRLPLDLKNRMLENLCRRSSYDRTWNFVLALGCSIFKKYQIDRLGKDEVNEMLDATKQDRNYRYGRLLAVYEKIEQDALDSRVSDSKDRRATNAERLWSAYTKAPDRTLRILEDKVRPYRERLIKSSYGSVIYYDGIIREIMIPLREADDYEQGKNKALSEDFVFGYYAQKQEFYRKKENKQSNQTMNQGEGGNN